MRICPHRAGLASIRIATWTISATRSSALGDGGFVLASKLAGEVSIRIRRDETSIMRRSLRHGPQSRRSHSSQPRSRTLRPNRNRSLIGQPYAPHAGFSSVRGAVHGLERAARPSTAHGWITKATE